MLKNYLKIALRNLIRHKGYSIINIAGLAVGMACCILIMLYIQFELSYDTMHEKADRIFRVACYHPGDANANIDSNYFVITPYPLASALKDEFPEVSYATKIRPVERLLLTKEEKNFFERGLFADKDFFKVFSFKLLKGDKNRVLEKLESIVISHRLAEKFFGNEDPIGKTLNCSLGDLEIAGIVEDVPENSHIQFDWIIPFAKQFPVERRARLLIAWNIDNCYTYFVLSDGIAYQEFEQKLNLFMKKVYSGKYRETTGMRYDYRKKTKHFLQPVKSIHLESHCKYEFSANNDIKYIRLFFTIAVFILLIACMNYINMTTANAPKRAKEIGVRKVVGAQRWQLFWQFTGEFILISALALFIALSLVHTLLPWFNGFIERNIELSTFSNWRFILGLFVVVVVAGLLAGIYPALVLSSFKPVKILREKIGDYGKMINLRNMLVLFQFSTTIILIISSLLIFRQIKYIKNMDTGFNREQVVVMLMTDPGIRENFTSFKNEILQNPNVINITTASHLLTDITTGTGNYFKTEDGKEIIFHLQWLGADYNFFDVFRMEIVQGRSFSSEYGTDEEDAVIVNEAFVKRINWSQPIGKRVPRLWIGDDEDGNMVVGVVKDFNFRSLHSEIGPLVIGCRPNSYIIYIRIRASNIPITLAHLKEIYERFNIRYPFEYSFLNDRFKQKYKSEEKLGLMFAYFSGLAIFIACLGIFGLVSYAAERRTKEIGIRKILGASAPGILVLLLKEFAKLVLIANIIAWPIAYYAMNRWLQGFAYRTNIGITTFILSAALALFIALATVSYQAIKAAYANPVESLRYE